MNLITVKLMHNNDKAVWYSLGHAVLVFIYTSGVAWLLFNAQSIFGQVHNFFGPLAMLMLFVLSAAIVGSLVLGRPAWLYFDGQKKEALQFLGYTILWLFILTVIVFTVLIAMR